MSLRKAVVAVGLGAMVASLPVVAQQAASIPVIGLLSSRSPTESAHLIVAFRQGLAEAGYTEGKNVTIEYRWAEGKYERLPGLAAELVRKPVAVIATVGGSVSALAGKAATTTIPVVFLSGGDLVKLGLVTSLNRPGGNVTGVSQFTTQLVAKRLELLREISPKLTLVGMLLNPKSPNAELELSHAHAAAKTLNIKLVALNAGTEAELDAAFASLAQQRAGGLVVAADPYLDGRRAQAVALAAKYAIPTVYPTREHAVAGGLISYGPNFPDTYREAGAYVGKILKGAKPGDLPVLQPSKFEQVVNMKTAKALGITVPQSVVVRMDEALQ